MSPDPRYGWRDDDRVVPAYALTQGRTRSRGEDLPLETLVQATEFASPYEPTLQPESQVIIALAARPISVAEIAAKLRVPIGVARVLVGDLAESGHLTVSLPPATDADGRPTRPILERLRDGLRTR